MSRFDKENHHPGVIGQGRKVVVPGAGSNRMPFRPLQQNIINVDSYPRVGSKRGSLQEKCTARMSNKKPIYKKELEEDVNMEPDDISDPIVVQHTEKLLEEIDRMVEVEMKDIEVDDDEEEEEEEPIIDIDIADENNQLAVVEYIDDLYTHYKKTEGSNLIESKYMEQQLDINERMRGILIDWLIEVHHKFELMEETLYLTVNLIDRFLAIYHEVPRNKLQLVGVTALLIACKFEEVSVPVVGDLILISNNAFSRKEILQMEKLMLNKLQFNMSVPTQYVFMRRFLKAAMAQSSNDDDKKKLEVLSFYILDLCLVQYESLRFPNSLMAAAAIFTAQCALKGRNIEWSRTCEVYTGYSKDQLLECSRMMVVLHEKAGDGKLTGVYRKYNTSKFGHISSKVEAAHFLLLP